MVCYHYNAVMADETDINRQLKKYFIFSYAKEILDICRRINTERCIGCQYNDPIQLHHDCLTVTDAEATSYHFNEAIKYIDHCKIPMIFDKNTDNLDIKREDVQKFKKSFNWDWWSQGDKDKLIIEGRIEEAVNILTVFQ